MARQKRGIQAAVRAIQTNFKVSTLEKLIAGTSAASARKYGIPNTVKLGTNCIQDRQYAGNSAARQVFSFVPADVLSWGSIVEVCSPSRQLSRDVASQAALCEATKRPVLWMTLGHAAHPGGSCSSLLEAANVTVQQWPITSAADTREALGWLLQLVRSEQYSLVVLDHIQDLAPPLPGAAPPPLPGPASAAGQPAPRPVVVSSGSVEDGACAALGASPAGRGAEGKPSSAAQQPAVGSAAAGDAAELAAGGMTLLSKADAAGAVSGSSAAAPAAAAGAVLTGAGSSRAAETAARPAAPVSAAAAAAVAAAAGVGGGGKVPGARQDPAAASRDLRRGVNLKFLHNVLPSLLEAQLKELHVSCGPTFRTTMMLLNTYNRVPAQTRTPPGSAGAGGSSSDGSSTSSGGSGDGHRSELRSRWARRAIARYAVATLHVLPQLPEGRAGRPSGPDVREAGAAAAGAPGAAAPGAEVGGCVTLHGEVTCGRAAEGEDGQPVWQGSIWMPVRHAGPKHLLDSNH